MTLNRQDISTSRGLPRRVSGEGANVTSTLARWGMGVEALEEDLDMSLRFNVSAGVQEQERTRTYTKEELSSLLYLPQSRRAKLSKPL